MSNISNCDRCGRELDITNEGSGMTAGYYDVTGKGEAFSWKSLAAASDEEKRICDKCMWATPGYRKAYGLP
jgi:hypothetical protein